MRYMLRLVSFALVSFGALKPGAGQTSSVRQSETLPSSSATQLGQSAENTGDTRTVSLRSLVDELEKDNPDIRAARYRFEAASKRPSQVGTLPEPRVQVVNFGVGHPFSTLNVSNFAYQAVGASQEIPFPGKLALASEEARREAQSEFEAYRGVTLDAIARLKIA